MDEGFFRRVVVTGIVVAAIVAMMVWTWVGKGAALALGAGFVISMGILQGTIAYAHALLRPPDERVGRGTPVVALHVAKYVVAGVLMWLCIVYWSMPPGWFAGGLSLPLAIMFLKFAGRAATKRGDAADGGE
jgi:hypothetical protein